MNVASLRHGASAVDVDVRLYETLAGEGKGDSPAETDGCRKSDVLRLLRSVLACSAILFSRPLCPAHGGHCFARDLAVRLRHSVPDGAGVYF